MQKRASKKFLHLFTIVLGFLMHILLLWGVMDANFHSPIITGLPETPMPEKAPAKRVIVFLADGLRYRTFKDHPPPFLRQIASKQGVWGISNTRMPTESRPGNIAIAAGLYEDPSAVFRGWKENPVEFDSIFNQSSASWIWGSPDIVSLFTKSGKSSIQGASYSAEWQDFDPSNLESTKRLDSWVFDQYWRWLNVKATDFRDTNKLIFYLHLLGCDTAGHASKPNSRNYIDGMMHVDEGIKQVVSQTENFFEKNTTAYVFASDHGMTDWGSHGSGSPDETETPFVVWGSGVANTARFHDIEQADLTPLISALIGIPVPVNNEGILPHTVMDIKYEEYVAKAFLSNVKQLSEQVKANRELIIGKGLANIYDKDMKLNQNLKSIEKMIERREFNDSIQELKGAANLAKQSLIYYRRYQTTRFLNCLFLMWLGWIVLLFIDMSSASRDSTAFPRPYLTWTIIPNVAFTVSLIPLFIEYAITGFRAWRLFGYGVIAATVLWLAARKLVHNSLQLDWNSPKPVVEILGIFTLILCMFLGMIYRWVFSIGMLITIVIQKITLGGLHFFFLISGLALAIFPLMPVVEPKPRVYIVLITLFLITLLSVLKKRRVHFYVRFFEFSRLILTMLVCSGMLNGKTWASWFILFSTPLIIWMYSFDWQQKFFGITIALACPLALLSTSYETLFFLTMSIHIQYWPLNHYMRKGNVDTLHKLGIRHLTVSAFLMLYILLCFFGTGNMASISSFDPLWTRHFYTVFSPFKMAVLILLKVAIPMILVGCLIRVLASDTTIFFGVLLLGDCLAIPLMYCVTPYGSWLDIGSAISRFVIAIMLPCILLVVYYVSKPLLLINLQRLIEQRYGKKHIV